MESTQQEVRLPSISIPYFDFYRYRWLITGKYFDKSCRTKVFNLSRFIIRWQKLGSWISWLAWRNDFYRYGQFFYVFTGIRYFVQACWTKVVLIIKIYYMISRIRAADKMARLERRFFDDIDNSFLVNISFRDVESPHKDYGG